MKNGGSRGQPWALRRLFFDVKTIHGGTEFYYTPWAEREQSGAVHAREVRVCLGRLPAACEL